MNVGDYVRTKDGYISKIKELGINIYTDVGCWSEDYVIKTSPNIIDLIQIGDIIKLDKDRTYCVLENDGKYIRTYSEDYLTAGDIKSIVTKEQFESMEYKL